MKKRMLLISFFLLLLSCSKDETSQEKESILNPEIVSVIPNSAVVFETVKITLANATLNNTLSVKLNDINVEVFTDLNTDTEVFFEVPPLTDLDDLYDLSLSYDTTEAAIELKDIFEIKRMQIDSISSNIIFKNNDTISLYGKNFPKTTAEGFHIYERLIDGDFDGYAKFVHKIDQVYQDSLVGVFNDLSDFSSQGHDLYVTFTKGQQFVSSTEVAPGEFLSLGIFEFSSFFQVQPLTVYTPEQRFFIRNNNFEDKIFVNGIEATRLFSAPEIFEDFVRRSGYQIPAELSAGIYEVTGTTEDGIPLKNIGIESVEVSDISYCLESNSAEINGTFRIIVSPIGAIDKFSCNNCPSSAALVDNLSGMRWELEIDAFNDISYENDITYFEFDVPADIVPNGIYSLSFQTRNGYTYVANEDCLNQKLLVQ